MKQELSKLDITDALAGNITRLRAIGELLDAVEGPQAVLPRGTTLLIDDVTDSLNEVLSHLYNTIDESKPNKADNNIGEDLIPSDLPR